MSRPDPRPPRDPFGEVLPDRTRDEESAGWGDGHDTSHDSVHDWDDERLRREVPPHHG